VAKLRADVLHRGLSLLVLAEWHSPHIMRNIGFFDENTKRCGALAPLHAPLPTCPHVRLALTPPLRVLCVVIQVVGAADGRFESARAE
jgi:hypothetical protein